MWIRSTFNQFLSLFIRLFYIEHKLKEKKLNSFAFFSWFSSFSFCFRKSLLDRFLHTFLYTHIESTIMPYRLYVQYSLNICLSTLCSIFEIWSEQISHLTKCVRKRKNKILKIQLKAAIHVWAINSIWIFFGQWFYKYRDIFSSFFCDRSLCSKYAAYVVIPLSVPFYIPN